MLLKIQYFQSLIFNIIVVLNLHIHYDEYKKTKRNL